MYFKTWKKENIFSTRYKLHLRILTLILRLFSLTRKKKEIRDAHTTQFCSWKRLLESLSLPMLLVITNSAILYARSTYLHLAFSHSPVLSLTLAFSSSTRSIYLSIYYLPVVHSSASNPMFYGFYAMYISLDRPVAKESRMLIQKNTQFYKTSTSQNFNTSCSTK